MIFFCFKMSRTRLSLRYVHVLVFVFETHLVLFTSAVKDARDTRICPITGNFSCGLGLCCCSHRPSTEIVANCSGLGADLRYIPKIKGNLKILYFSGNYLPDLSAKTLSNITKGICIRQVSITNSGVSSISKDAFEKLKCLNRLDLSNNKGMDISQLKIGMESANPFISLDLNNISLYHFPDIESKTLQKLFIKNNLLTTLSLQPLLLLENLNRLDVSDNRIQDMPIGVVVPHIRYLRVAGNLLKAVPTLCPKNGTEVPLPNLKKLDLAYNAILTVSSDSFSCLQDLIILNLRGNAVSILTTNMFSSLPKLRRLNLADMRPRLDTIEPYAFNSSSLLVLQLDMNSFDLELGTTRNSFANLPKLERIVLSHNDLSGRKNNSSVLTDRLSPLKNLKKLIIQSANVSWIPTALFKHCPKLTQINAMANPIQDLKGSFVFARSLEHLTVSYSKITVVKEDDFPAKVRATLKYLDMGFNPYSCSCDNTWFRNWLTGHGDTIELPYWPESYYCRSPFFIRNVNFVDFHPSVDSCQGSNDAILWFLIAGSIVVFIALVTQIVCIVTWNRLFPNLPGIVNEITNRKQLLHDA